MRSSSTCPAVGRPVRAFADAHLTAVGLILAVTLALPPGPAWCQGSSKPSAADFLAKLRVGQWIQLEGQVGNGTGAACTVAKQLAGDYLDDDWAIRGTVQALETGRQEFTVGGCRVRVNGSTTYDDPHGKVKGLNDLRVGVLVDVEGTFLRDHLLAAEVDEESEDLERRPALKDMLLMVGRIERVDPRRQVITVMGVDFQLSAKTKLRSAIR